MKAIVLEKTCKAEDLKVTDVPMPKIEEDKVIVKVNGFGINRSEVILRDYEADEPYIKLPRIPGIECVGEIIDPSNSPFKKGDIVCCLMEMFMLAVEWKVKLEMHYLRAFMIFSLEKE